MLFDFLRSEYKCLNIPCKVLKTSTKTYEKHDNVWKTMKMHIPANESINVPKVFHAVKGKEEKYKFKFMKFSVWCYNEDSNKNF